MRIPRWETPVPIPNTAVKPPRADGSKGAALCESRLLPGYMYKKESTLKVLSFLILVWGLLYISLISSIPF